MLAEHVIIEVFHLFCHYLPAKQYSILLRLHPTVNFLQAERCEEGLQHCVQVASIAEILDASMRHSPDFNLAADCDLRPRIGDALLEAPQSQNRVTLVLRTIVEKLVLYGIPAELAPYASVLDLQEEVVTGSGVVVLEAGKRSLVLQADGAPAVQAEVVQGQIHVERTGLGWLVIGEVFDGLLGEEFGVRAGGFALLHSLLLSENNGYISLIVTYTHRSELFEVVGR